MLGFAAKKKKKQLRQSESSEELWQILQDTQ